MQTPLSSYHPAETGGQSAMRTWTTKHLLNDTGREADLAVSPVSLGLRFQKARHHKHRDDSDEEQHELHAFRGRRHCRLCSIVLHQHAWGTSAAKVKQVAFMREN